MSVTKDGADDHNCGFTNNDPLHQAICRVIAGGITVVAAAANDSHSASRNIPASYNEVITVSALADTDGRPGGLGGNRCFSWGSYDKDDTFAELQQLRRRRRHHGPGQMHHVDDPGPGLRLHVGHVDGRPDGRRRGRALQGEPPEGDAGRGPRGAALPRQPELEDLHRPRFDPRAAARRVEDRAARDLRPEPGPVRPSPRKAASRPRSRSPSPAARPSSSGSSCRSRRCPSGWTGTLVPDQRASAGRPTSADHLGRRAQGHARRHVPHRRPGHEPGPDRHAQHPGQRRRGRPDRPATGHLAGLRRRRWAGPRSRSACHGRRPPIRPARSPATRSSGARTAAPGPPRSRRRSASPWPTYTLGFDTVYRFRVRAVDAAGHWSPWVEAAGTSRIHPFDDRSSSVTQELQLAPVVDRGRIPVDAERIDQGRREDQPELHRPRGRRGDAADAASRQGQGLHRRRVRPHAQPQGGDLGQPPGRLRTWYFPSGGSHRITLKVVGTGTYPLVRLDAFVVSR